MTTPFVLDATTKSIQAVMSGAATTTNPSVTAAWADDTGSAFTEGASDTALNGSTPVTLVAAPASSTRRIIKNITIANIDTAPVTITLSYNDNSTLRTVVKVTLAVNDTWTTDGTYDSAGNLKTSLSSFSGLVLPANGGTGVANNNASTLTISGNFATTLTVTSATGVTLPTSGTLYGTATGSITSAQLATSLTDETGSGANVFANTPTLVTPILGAATATSVNGLTITTTTGTLTMTNAKALAVTNTLTLSGTDSTVMTFPSTTASIARIDAAQTFAGIQTASILNLTPQAITVTTNAGTADISHGIQNFTNSSAAAMTITLTTTSAVDGQWKEVRIYDFSGVAEGITWVNTENSTVTVPTTSNGSTTLPLSVLFQFNSATTKWRCVASS